MQIKSKKKNRAIKNRRIEQLNINDLDKRTVERKNI